MIAGQQQVAGAGVGGIPGMGVAVTDRGRTGATVKMTRQGRLCSYHKKPTLSVCVSVSIMISIRRSVSLSVSPSLILSLSLRLSLSLS